jgi:putative DNA primase/helicase
LHRVPVEDRPKSDKPGWYVLHAPSGGRPHGVFGRWDDARGTDCWHADSETKPLTKAEKAAFAKLRSEQTARRVAEFREAAKAAQAQWEKYSPEGQSPYLKRKRVKALGVRFDGQLVCVPLRDTDGALWTFQRISANGEKRFFPGGRAIGCFHLIGQIQAEKPLLMVEGYATGATLHQITGAAVVCAMTCGNLAPVLEAIKKRHSKVRIIICADDDAKTERERGINPGIQAAREAAKRFNCEWTKPEGLPDGGTDFNDLAVARGADLVKAQLETVLTRGNVSLQPKNNSVRDQWPEPILPGPEPVPDIPANLLPGWVGDMASAVARDTQTPEAMAVMMAIAVLGAVIQRRVEVMPTGNPGHIEILAIWTIAVMPSASRKSAVFSALQGVLIAWEKSEGDRKRREINQVFAKREVITKRIEQLKINAGKENDATKREKIEEDIAAERERLPPELYPPRIFTGDVTSERLQQILAEQGERIAIMSDEAGIFQNIAGMYSKGVSNMEIHLKAQTGTSVRVDRATRNAHLDRPALTIGLAIQPGILKETGKNKGFRDSGLLARFLYAVPRSNVGTRDVRAQNPVPTEVAAKWNDGIRSLLDGLDKPIGAIKRISFDADAKDVWLDFAQEIEEQQGEGGRYAHMSDWTGKLSGMTARLAALFEVAVRGIDAPSVSRDSAERAVKLARLLVPHAEAAFAIMGAPDKETDAFAVLEWVRRNHLESFTRREAQKAMESRFRLVEDLIAAAKVLQERAILSRDQFAKGARGAPSCFYEVNPKIFVDKSNKSQ